MDTSRQTSRGRSSSSGGGCGCLGIITFVFIIWALLFGVTVDGTHYDVGCGCDNGVEVNTSRGRDSR